MIEIVTVEYRQKCLHFLLQVLKANCLPGRVSRILRSVVRPLQEADPHLRGARRQDGRRGGRDRQDGRHGQRCAAPVQRQGIPHSLLAA